MKRLCSLVAALGVVVLTLGAAPAGAMSRPPTPVTVRVVCPVLRAKITADHRTVTCSTGRMFHAPSGQGFFSTTGGFVIQAPTVTIHGILYPPYKPSGPLPVRIRTYKTSTRLADGTLVICQHYMDDGPPVCIEYPPATPPETKPDPKPEPTPDPDPLIANLHALGLVP